MVINFPRTNNAPQRIARPASVALTGTPFQDPTPKRKKHAAEPIKSLDDIIRIQDHMISHSRYRDNLLFTMGINFGFRCGDLLKIKVGHLLSPDGQSYRESVTLVEEKTGKYRTAYINDAVMDAADLYFQDLMERDIPVDLNNYLFTGNSNRCDPTKPMDVYSVERILKKTINEELGIEVKASTHCLRKTFAYHVITSAPDRSRALELLMNMFGHASTSVTIKYAGITDEEMMGTYKTLNLGRTMDFSRLLVAEG